MPVEVLLIEDSSGDVRLMREVFLGVNDAVHLVVASDGVEAMALLSNHGAHANDPRPDLILLDLKLPKMDGREVLAHIKTNASLKMIPIIVLTTSEEETDIVKSYQLQANCFLSKPGQLNEFEMLMKSINDFWLTEVKSPRRRQSG